MYPRWLVAFAFAFALVGAVGFAQEDDEKPAAGKDKPAASKDKSAEQEYRQLFNQWKELIARMSQLKAQYENDPGADKQALETQFNELLKKANAIAEPLGAAGERAYLESPNADKELTGFLLETVRGYIGADDHERAAHIAEILIDNKCPSNELDFLAGLAFYYVNDFDKAQKYLQAAKEKGATNEHANQLLASIDKAREAWEKESKIRELEESSGLPKARQLPKVKLTTSQGDIVLVLFENQAPIATANFISLIEKGFYDGLTFHRVLQGFMAQGGDPSGDGSGGPGYTIPDECRQSNHRNHFRGSLSMAKATAPDSGGSQFFITFTPTTHLDGKHTVFGHVVEGMEVLAKLHRTDGSQGVADPDKIIKATVLQKRNHPYNPVKQFAKGEKEKADKGKGDAKSDKAAGDKAASEKGKAAQDEVAKGKSDKAADDAAADKAGTGKKK